MHLGYGSVQPPSSSSTIELSTSSSAACHVIANPSDEFDAMVFPPEESARRREIRLGKRPAADVSRLQNQGEQNIFFFLLCIYISSLQIHLQSYTVIR
jgi:hypothetical protein